MREFLISENDSDQRVDKFLMKTMNTMPKNLMYKYIRNKKIKVNRKRCEISQRLQVGDTIQCYISEEFFIVERDLDFLNVSSHLDIIYEDQNILILNKAKGLLAHRDEQGIQDNLLDRMLHYLYNKQEYIPSQELSFTPALCHRIDRNTQGIVIAAKNAMALREMNVHIKNREVIKKYVCLVEGVLHEKKAHVSLYHKKGDSNKAIVSKVYKEGFKKMELVYQVIEECPTHSFIDVELISGKSHQIRSMMSYLGHPLVGDVKYGAKKDGKQGYQELCAYYIAFQFSKDCALSYLNGKIFKLQHTSVKKRFLECKQRAKILR